MGTMNILVNSSIFYIVAIVIGEVRVLYNISVLVRGLLQHI